MPTYQYECNKCGYFEYYQSMYESPLVVCPHCESKHIKKLISSPTVRFVGNGFYSTDNRK